MRLWSWWSCLGSGRLAPRSLRRRCPSGACTGEQAQCGYALALAYTPMAPDVDPRQRGSCSPAVLGGRRHELCLGPVGCERPASFHGIVRWGHPFASMSMLPVLLRKFTGSNEILVSQCSLLVLEACLAPRRRGFHVDEHPIECGNNSLTHPPLNTDRGASKSKFLSIEPSIYTDCDDRQ